MLRSLLPYLMISILLYSACSGEKSMKNWTAEEINATLSHVNENDLKFVEKGISFDSIITIAGTRQYQDQTQRVKMKLFFFGNGYCRGYYNVADKDQSNLQVFGKRVNDLLTLKCVTKINMEEAGGYTILTNDYQGIWSSGHHNFTPQDINMKKQNIDYNNLVQW